jgi:hypothetical protein
VSGSEIKQRGDTVERVDFQIVLGVAYRFDGFQCATTREHSQARKQHLLTWLQQAVAPINRCP